MAVQKKEVSKARGKMGRAHHALSASAYVECANCGELKRPHHIGQACGHYGDREMVEAAGA